MTTSQIHANPAAKTAGFLGYAVLFLLSACASNTELTSLPPAPTTVAPVAPAADTLAPYHLQVGDVLEIKLPLNPELNETVTVRPDGLISTSVAEGIPAYNLTVAELNGELKEAYKEDLLDPRIFAVVRSFAPTRIYVSGEVVNPGEFIVVGPSLTLTQAIARAGGIKNSADEEHVVILRRGSSEESKAFVANYNAATQLGNAALDARLAPYDVVFVPKSGAARTYRDFQQYFQQYVSPSIGATATYSFNN